VKEANRSDLVSHSDACVVGKDALIFWYFHREVIVSGYDPDGEKISLKTVHSLICSISWSLYIMRLYTMYRGISIIHIHIPQKLALCVLRCCTSITFQECNNGLTSIARAKKSDIMFTMVSFPYHRVLV
jgi:hypothetical protein